MLADHNFTMRVSKQDKKMLAHIAKQFQRSQADVLKLFVRETYELLKAETAQERKPTQEQPAAA